MAQCVELSLVMHARLAYTERQNEPFWSTEMSAFIFNVLDEERTGCFLSYKKIHNVNSLAQFCLFQIIFVLRFYSSTRFLRFYFRFSIAEKRPSFVLYFITRWREVYSFWEVVQLTMTFVLNK